MVMTPADFVNWGALALSLAFILIFGQKPERLGIVTTTLGYLVTALVQQKDSWTNPQFAVLTVDVIFTGAIIFIAFRYHRLWPIWAAAFQAIAVLCHLAFMIDPGALYRAFYFANFSIGYLLLGSIVGGVIMESRAPPRLRFPAHRGAP